MKAASLFLSVLLGICLSEGASAESIRCFTNHIEGAETYSKFWVFGDREGQSLQRVKVEGYNGITLTGLRVKLKKENNPSGLIRTDVSGGSYLQYLIEETDGGGTIEVLLPMESATRYYGYISYLGSKRQLLVCLGE